MVIVCTACTAERPASQHPEVIEDYQRALLQATGWLTPDEDTVPP